MHGRIPEQRLLAAVVAVAVRDSMAAPYRPVDSREYRMRTEAITAFNFLMTDDCEGYLQWLDIDAGHFRQKLLDQMDDRTPKSIPFSPEQRRAFRVNHSMWLKLLSTRGISRVEAEEEDDEDEQPKRKKR